MALLKGATAGRKLVTDQIQGIFQTLKQEAGGVFDALVTKSQSVWSALGNSLKTALLTAIKDVVRSEIAAMLTVLVTGQNPVQGGTSGGGMLSGGAMIRKLMASGAAEMLFGRSIGVLADKPSGASLTRSLRGSARPMRSARRKRSRGRLWVLQ